MNFDESLLTAYLDDELTPEERALVEQQLATHPEHRETLRQLGELQKQLAAVPQEFFSTDPVAAVQKRIRAGHLPETPLTRVSQPRPSWHLWLPLALAASGLAMLTVASLRQSDEVAVRGPQAESYNLGIDLSEPQAPEAADPLDRDPRTRLNEPADKAAVALRDANSKPHSLPADDAAAEGSSLQRRNRFAAEDASGRRGAGSMGGAMPTLKMRTADSPNTADSSKADLSDADSSAVDSSDAELSDAELSDAELSAAKSSEEQPRMGFKRPQPFAQEPRSLGREARQLEGALKPGEPLRFDFEAVVVPDPLSAGTRLYRLSEVAGQTRLEALDPASEEAVAAPEPSGGRAAEVEKFATAPRVIYELPPGEIDSILQWIDGLQGDDSSPRALASGANATGANATGTTARIAEDESQRPGIEKPNQNLSERPVAVLIEAPPQRLPSLLQSISQRIRASRGELAARTGGLAQRPMAEAAEADTEMSVEISPETTSGGRGGTVIVLVPTLPSERRP